jgi:hypothetical protein
MTKDYGYSYEVYSPGEGIDKGPRIDYEDHFTSRSAATMAMRYSLEKAPPGSSAFVCKRYDDGEMTCQRHFVKREKVFMLS